MFSRKYDLKQYVISSSLRTDFTKILTLALHIAADKNALRGVVVTVTKVFHWQVLHYFYILNRGTHISKYSLY